MARRNALLFPGQGSYLPGCLSGVARLEEVGQVLHDVDAVAEAFGTGPVAPLLLDAEAPDIQTLLAAEPERLQLAIFAASLAVGSLLTARLRDGDVVLVGHSLGEITALTAAGVYSAADGARILCERDRLVRAAGLPPGGLLALGASVSQAEGLMAEAGRDELDVAARNAPRQTIVSGPDGALNRLASLAGRAGIHHKRLMSPYPYHHRMMEPVARQLTERVADIPVRPGKHPVYSPLHMAYYRDLDDATAMMCRHLVLPVSFLAALRELQEDGTDVFVEAGALSILTGIVRSALGAVRTVAPLDGVPSGEEFEAAVAAVPGARPLGGDARIPAQRRAGEADLLAELRSLYAAALEYPEEYLEPTTDLEADLGVDSVQRTEVLAQVFAHYGLEALPNNFRISGYATLDAVAKLLIERGLAR